MSGQADKEFQSYTQNRGESKMTREQELRKIRAKRKKLLAKKARKEKRADLLIRLALALMGAGVFYLFFGMYGLAFIGLVTLIKTLINSVGDTE